MSITACIPPRSLHGYGAFVRMWDVAASEWIVIAGTMDVPLPSVTREAIETNDDDGDGKASQQLVLQLAEDAQD